MFDACGEVDGHRSRAGVCAYFLIERLRVTSRTSMRTSKLTTRTTFRVGRGSPPKQADDLDLDLDLDLGQLWLLAVADALCCSLSRPLPSREPSWPTDSGVQRAQRRCSWRYRNGGVSKRKEEKAQPTITHHIFSHACRCLLVWELTSQEAQSPSV